MNVAKSMVEVLKSVGIEVLGYQESQHQILGCWMVRLVSLVRQMQVEIEVKGV